MKKLSFPEKNQLLQQLKNEAYFDQDLELFKKVRPKSRLINELARANRFTKPSLEGRMILEMLDVVSAEEIIANRTGKAVASQQEQQNSSIGAQTSVIYTEDDVRTLLGAMYSEENSALLKECYENYKLQVKLTLGTPKSLPVWYEVKFINSKKAKKLTVPDSDKKKDELNPPNSPE